MTREPNNLYVGILLGGQSTRMGAPKHGLKINDRSFFEIIQTTAAPFAAGVFALGPPLAGVSAIPDVEGARGPLAGILAALRHPPEADWLIVACDMPFVSPAAIEWLLSFRGSAAAVIPLSPGGRVEPLFALYSPAIRTEVEELIRTPNAAPRLLAQKEGVLTPQIPEPLVPAWRNINTPLAYDSARRVGEASSRTVPRSGEP